MKEYLLVVLQTHSKSNSGGDYTRYCGSPKIEVSSRCVYSLIDSLNYAIKNKKNLEVELQIFDDHSHDEFLETLNKLISTANFKVSLTHLESRGIMPSILRCYEHGRDHGKDWVYFIQDDFLFQQNSIDLILYAANQFSCNLGAPASIHAFNDPYEYTQPENVELKSHIVISKDRYWRTNIHAVFSLFTHHSIIKDNWDLFYKMGTSEISSTMELYSISKLFWSRGYYQFTPIPSLCLHIQGEREKDPFIDWKSWWDQYNLRNLNEKTD
jgi:hypothetical protein